MLKIFIITSFLCWIASAAVPCPPANPPEFLLGYPVCKSGYTNMMDCEFKPNIIVKYCYKGNGNTKPTLTTPKLLTSTLMTTLHYTSTLQETTKPAKTSGPQETTNIQSTTKSPPAPPPDVTSSPQEPITTKVTTASATEATKETTPQTTETTSEPLTTPKQKSCGVYPIEGKMWNADITTKCQPWLVSLQIMGLTLCNAVLVNDDTILTDSTCVKKSELLKNLTAVIGGEEQQILSLDNDIMQLFGKGVTVIKLKEKVDLSKRCVNPVCIPNSKTDYDTGNCRVGAHGFDDTAKAVTFIKDIGLIDEKTCLASKPARKDGSKEDVPDTLCTYPFVQGSSKDEKGGMLICRGKSTPSQWMLVGLTYDVSNGNKKANDTVYYWDIVKLRPYFEPTLNM